jgi:hypothetical protein
VIISNDEGILERKAIKNRYINPIIKRRDTTLSGTRLIPKIATNSESTIGYKGPWKAGYLKE